MGSPFKDCVCISVRYSLGALITFLIIIIFIMTVVFYPATPRVNVGETSAKRQRKEMESGNIGSGYVEEKGSKSIVQMASDITFTTPLQTAHSSSLPVGSSSKKVVDIYAPEHNGFLSNSERQLLSLRDSLSERISQHLASEVAGIIREKIGINAKQEAPNEVKCLTPDLDQESSLLECIRGELGKQITPLVKKIDELKDNVSEMRSMIGALTQKTTVKENASKASTPDHSLESTNNKLPDTKPFSICSTQHDVKQGAVVRNPDVDLQLSNNITTKEYTLPAGNAWESLSEATEKKSGNNSLKTDTPKSTFGITESKTWTSDTKRGFGETFEAQKTNSTALPFAASDSIRPPLATENQSEVVSTTFAFGQTAPQPTTFSEATGQNFASTSFELAATPAPATLDNPFMSTTASPSGFGSSTFGEAASIGTDGGGFSFGAPSKRRPSFKRR